MEEEKRKVLFLTRSVLRKILETGSPPGFSECVPETVRFGRGVGVFCRERTGEERCLICGLVGADEGEISRYIPKIAAALFQILRVSSFEEAVLVSETMGWGRFRARKAKPKRDPSRRN